MFKLSGEVTYVRSYWQSNFEVKRSRTNVAEAEM